MTAATSSAPAPNHATSQQSTAGTETRTRTDEQRLGRLRWWNLIVGLIHLTQGIVIIALSNDFTLPITAQFLGGPPGSEFTEREVLWDVPIGIGVAIFLFFAAVDHLLMAAPGVWNWYSNNLRRGRNLARWWEYSISASLMIVLIGQIVGISDFGALAAMFGANAAMILFGLLMETTNPDRERVHWSSYVFGCIVGAIPWLIIGYQFIGAENRAGGEGVPTFVYAIVISLFLLFNSFAVNMLLQYRRVGPWRSYLFGEVAYMVLSLTAKTALAWQVFANTLVG